jgi:hypothetical protein
MYKINTLFVSLVLAAITRIVEMSEEERAQYSKLIEKCRRRERAVANCIRANYRKGEGRRNIMFAQLTPLAQREIATADELQARGVAFENFGAMGDTSYCMYTYRDVAIELRFNEHYSTRGELVFVVTGHYPRLQPLIDEMLLRRGPEQVQPLERKAGWYFTVDPDYREFAYTHNHEVEIKEALLIVDAILNADAPASAEADRS